MAAALATLDHSAKPTGRAISRVGGSGSTPRETLPAAAPVDGHPVQSPPLSVCPSGQVLKGGGSAVDHVLQHRLAHGGLHDAADCVVLQGEDPGGWLEGLLAPPTAGGGSKARSKPKSRKKK